MTTVPGSGGQTTRTRPGEAGAAPPPMKGGIDPDSRDRRHPAVGSVIGDTLARRFEPVGVTLSSLAGPMTDIGGFLKLAAIFLTKAPA